MSARAIWRPCRQPEGRCIETASLTLPAGEKTKSFEHLITACDTILAARIERNDAVIALGGVV